MTTKSIFFMLVLHSSICWLFGQSASVPLDHWVYSFLDRLETKGVIAIEDFNVRPLSRQAIAELLLQSVSIDNDPLLSRTEKKILTQLIAEFHEEIALLSSTARIDSHFVERHLFSWRTDDIEAHLDGLLSQDFRFETKEPADLGIPKSITSYGLQARVRLKKSMSIFVNARSFFLSEIDTLTNTTFSPSLGLPVTEKALVDVATTDNVSSTVKFQLPWFELELGRDLVEWGPGARGNLLVSRNANYYDMVKTSFRYKKATFEYVHAFLNAEQSKYLVAHRLELAPSRALRLSISESLIYSGRDVEPFYLNPFVPIIISERHVGNQDNNMLAIDGTYFFPKPQMKIYSEVLFDDFSFAKDFFESWGNKWAILAGFFWVDPFGFQNTELRFEAVRIQPFVYSHRDPNNTYSNYNNTIGHWLGPDADDLFLEIRHRLHKNVELGISWEQRRRAQNDINEGARPLDGRIKFLDGTTERNRYYGLQLEWQAMRDFFLVADYHFIQATDLHRVDGNSQDNHRLFLRAALNY